MGRYAMRFRAQGYVSMVLFKFLLALIILTTLGCHKEPVEEKELVLLCGSSFVKPTEQLCSAFTSKTGIKIVIAVAGSEDFLPLVKAGQQGDILVTHDPYLDYVADANILEDSVHVGLVAPVLAVQKDNPKGISSIEDLTQPGLKVALSDPKYSTCGRMVFQLLAKKGIKKAVMSNLGNRLSKGHSTLGTFLKTKTVDAVIMWNGVAFVFSEAVDIVPTPYEYDEEIRVHIIGLNYSKYPEEIEKFIAFTKAEGKKMFSKYGYVK
jgi:molybdate transport system substrate-binding protein